MYTSRSATLVQPHQRKRSVLGFVVLVAFLASAGSAGAQQIDVCVSFAGTGFTAVQQANLLAKAQAYFDAAGIGVGDPLQRVILVNAVPAPPNCDIATGFFNNVAKNFHGTSSKRNHVCLVNRAHFMIKFPGNFAAQCQAMAETLAHEIGHLLCAVHDCRGNGRKRVAGVGVVACNGAAPSLMTTGLCVRCANRGVAPPGVGSRSFSAFSILQMRLGIVRFLLPFNWSLRARFDEGVFCLVEGNSYVTPISLEGEILQAEDPLIDFTYEILSGDEALFEFGWLNMEDEFIEALDPADNPDQLLEEEGGAFLNFALRGRPATAFDGQVFDQVNFATVTLLGQEFPASSAATARVDVPYFSQAQIDFDVSGNAFLVLLNAEDWGDSNGFYLPTAVPVPSASRWSLVLMCLVPLLTGLVVAQQMHRSSKPVHAD